MKIDKGDWLFTCKLEPLQFSHWNNKDFDDFVTLNGSHHSRDNCSLNPVSAEYAKWFLENKIYLHFKEFEKEDNRWGLYENKVKSICAQHNIKYEGI